MINFACKKFNFEEIIKCGLGLTRAELSIFKFILTSDEWLSSNDISNDMKLDLSTVQRAMKKMFEVNVLDRRQNNLDQGGYVFVYSVKPRDDIKKTLMSIIHQWVGKVEIAFDEWMLE